MLVQFTEGMPGVAMDGTSVYFQSPFNPVSEWEKFYEASSEGHLDDFIIGKEYASGLHALLELLKGKKPLLIKGQIAGPITLGLSLLDEKKIPILYDPNLKEMLLKIIASKARWQEKEFRKVAPEAETLIFFDEPFLSSYGSISMNLGKEEIIECLNKVHFRPSRFIGNSYLWGHRLVHHYGNRDQGHPLRCLSILSQYACLCFRTKKLPHQWGNLGMGNCALRGRVPKS